MTVSQESIHRRRRAVVLLLIAVFIASVFVFAQGYSAEAGRNTLVPLNRPSSSDVGGAVPFTPAVEAMGSVQSVNGTASWELVGYDSPQGRCLDAEVRQAGVAGAISGCAMDVDIAREGLVGGMGGVDLGAGGRQQIAFGQAADGVVAVRLTLDDGSKVTVDVVNGIYGYAREWTSGEDFIDLMEGLDSSGKVVAVVDFIGPPPGEPFVEEREPLK